MLTLNESDDQKRRHYELFEDPVIAGAILDRLTHRAHQLQLRGESVRKKLGRAAIKDPLEPQPSTA
jgi:DNA replication protein DnaC